MGKSVRRTNTRYPLLQDEPWVREHYVDKGLSCREVAEIVGCGKGTVELALRRHGIQVRGRHYGRWNPKACERCGVQFTPAGPAARFCSAECRTGQRACKGCDQMFTPQKLPTGQQGPSDQMYCSDECRSWAATQRSLAYHDRRRASRTPARRRNSHGYMEIYYSQAGGGYRVLEHRQVMADHIGRPLLDSETVHHVNGDRADNRIENLQLRQGRHGKGVSLRCRDCGSHDVEAVPL